MVREQRRQCAFRTGNPRHRPRRLPSEAGSGKPQEVGRPGCGAATLDCRLSFIHGMPEDQRRVPSLVFDAEIIRTQIPNMKCSMFLASPRLNRRSGKRIALTLATMFATSASADLAVRQIPVFQPGKQSRVPAVTAQGRTLAPQAVSAASPAATSKRVATSST